MLELRSGLKDVRRPAELMHAYIVLSLLCGIRTEESWRPRPSGPAATSPCPSWRPMRCARCGTPRPTSGSWPTSGTADGVGDGWTPRELRTSFVSLLGHRGVSIEEIARLAGHASARTTGVVYRRELRPVITTGAEIMDELFSES